MSLKACTKFNVDDAIKQGVIKRLEQCNPVFPYTDNPLLASLTTCMGLQAELGDPTLDRLSPALNINLDDYSSNPWNSEIITYGNRFGIVMWIPKVDEFYPDHPDFSKVIHPFSLNEKNKLDKIVIFPEDVATSFQSRNLELVIVRDWVLSAFLAETNKQVNYFKTNTYEIEHGFSKVQAKMLMKRQVAFMGTHDLVDHLLDGNGEKISAYYDLMKEVQKEFRRVFHSSKKPKKSELIMAYLMGVILDDMAQPKRYDSKVHQYALIKAVRFLSSLECLQGDVLTFVPPQEFHRIIENLRQETAPTKMEIDHLFSKLFNFLLPSVVLPLAQESLPRR